MYAELILRPSTMAGQRIYPQDARRMVASALNGMPVKEAFFGRLVKPAPGRPTEGLFPVVPIVFNGGDGFVRIYGVGREGQMLLEDEMGRIVRAVTGLLGGTVAAEYRTGAHLRKHGERLFEYHIAKLALSKTGHSRKIDGQKVDVPLKERARGVIAAGNDLVALTPLIVDVIDKGIVSLASAFDQERHSIPSGDVVEAIEPALPENLGIRIHSGTPGLYQIHPGRPGHAYIVRNLRFSMLGDLYGPWSVGHLRSHGCGLIRRVVGESS